MEKIITDDDAIRNFDNLKKFYNAFRKINNVEINQNNITYFLTQLEKQRFDFYSINVNDFTILPFALKTTYMAKCEQNESKIMTIYERYLKEHVGYKFISFLKEQNALEEYIFNLEDQKEETLLYRILHHTHDNYINSFLWSLTEQGRDYWCKIDNLWHDIIYNEAMNTKIQPSFYKGVQKLLKKI
jgi:hypothetical protein